MSASNASRTASRAAALASDLVLKVDSDGPPSTRFVSGLLVDPAASRHEARWTADRAGFARISVIDAGGQAAGAAVRLG